MRKKKNKMTRKDLFIKILVSTYFDIIIDSTKSAKNIPVNVSNAIKKMKDSCLSDIEHIMIKGVDNFIKEKK